MKILFTSLSFLICFSLVSQTKGDLDFAHKINSGQKSFSSTIFPKLPNQNRIKEVMYQPYLFYKKFFSSQDGISCSFYPSCSSYAYQSIEKYGFVKGVLEGFDRISRCHNLDHKHYLKHFSGFWYDPVYK